MQMTIAPGTSAPISTPNGLVIQNLGPGTAYLGASNADATAGTGIEIPAGATYEFPRPLADTDIDNTVFVYADINACDIRYLEV